MRNANRGIGLVDVLAAGARGTKCIDAKVGRIDGDVVGNRVGLGEHGHRARRRMNAPLRLGLGYALHAVPSRLELELGVGTLPDDARDDFLEAAHVARAFRNQLELPFVAFGVARIHAKQVAREQCGLVAAGPGAYFEEHVALVVGIARQKGALQLFFERVHSRSRRLRFVVGERFRLRIGEHLLRRLKIALSLFPIAIEHHDRRDLGVLAGQRAIPVEIARRVLGAEQSVELLEPGRELGEFDGEGRFHKICHSAHFRN